MEFEGFFFGRGGDMAMSLHTYVLWVCRRVREMRESSRKFLVGILTFLVIMQNLEERLKWVKGLKG